jgi:hypothetical protein
MKYCAYLTMLMQKLAVFILLQTDIVNAENNDPSFEVLCSLNHLLI